MMFLDTIHRSIFKELVLTFLLGVVALNFILMTENLMRLTRLLSSVGASLYDMLLIVLYLQPQFSVLTMPMALFIATLLTYGRLNADNEVTVLRASGMSFRAISGPVFLLGTVCFLAGIAVSFHIAPASAAGLRAHVSEAIARRAPFAIEEGMFNTAFKDIVIYVKEKPSVETLSGIFIYDERKKGQPRVVFANKGWVSGTDAYKLSLGLSEGRIHIVRDTSSTSLSFGKYNLTLPVTLKRPRKKYNELTPLELLQGAGTSGKKQKVNMLLEFWRRLTLPAVCLLFMFLGPPLALKSGRAGKLGGLTMGLSIFAAYYAAMLYAENLSRSGNIPHYLGAWGPVAVMGIFALWMFGKADST